MSEEGNKQFEDVLEGVGNRGPAQVLIILFSIAIECTVGTSVNYFVLENGPKYNCITLDSYENATAVFGSVMPSTCANSTGDCTNSTLVPQYGIGKCPVAGKPCTNVTFIEDYTSIITEWNLTCDKYYLVKLTASIFFAGLLFGAICGGQLSDMFGRRPVLLASWTGLIAAQACLAAVPIWGLYAALRFIAGMFAGSCATVACILPIEYVAAKWRSFVAMRMGWGMAHFGIALVAYFLREWRHLALGTSLPFIPFLVLAFILLPESARWLIQKQRYEVAHKWLTFISKINRKTRPEMETLHHLGEVFARQQERAGHYSYVHLFATRTYAIRSSILLIGWFTCSIMSYGLKSQWASLTGSIYINLVIAAACNVFVRIIAPFIFNKLGRRPSYPLANVFPVIAMFTILIMDETGYMEGRETVRTILALVSYAIGVGAWLSVFLLTTEIYPTLIRNIASGAGNTSARIAGVLAPQIGLLKLFHPSIPYAVYGTLAVIVSILMFIFMPETLNKPLPENPPPGIGRKRSLKHTEGAMTGCDVINTESDQKTRLNSMEDEQNQNEKHYGRAENPEIEIALIGNGADFSLRRPDREAMA